MTAQSSILAWKIPMDRVAWWATVHEVTKRWTRLSDSLSIFTFMHWRRKWQPTPVFLPGESQGWGSMVGCHLWGRTESDTTEATWQQQQQYIYGTLIWKFTYMESRGFPGDTSGKEPACQCERHKICRFNPWIRKIPWRRAWQPTPVFLPGESPWTE